ncbi:leucyl/phenylalanyl-tRNA--protein transferase [Halopseudomonas pelagia]|uniref:leucyl/phenylalanyl-tRNA--protein transferase n=1 Tax=Halopseudomonas pelagia TaxID=553151 RepID=UPI000399A95D|nr:leucyl/phenylalanyl-tRNA--protein transferase [Halopseudomonas pelagia]|tara:strand:+ start:1471 stop:2184 length:714 start_codon:yes stop_codon:yes gene_type:complete
MLQLTWLDEQNLEFPPAALALDEPPGLLAVGGDLSPARLIKAYRCGIFPWYQDGQPLLWWCPHPRTVLLPRQLHVSRSLRKQLKHNPFRLSMDSAFAEVLRGCAEPRDYTDATWITEEMQQAYRKLHQLGIAHSVEVWEQEQLVGGLYGLALGKVFFGESMFSRRTNASKIAFVHLVTQLEAWGFELIDCQMPTDHLFSLGAHSVSREDFLAQLNTLCPEGPVSSAWGASTSKELLL